MRCTAGSPGDYHPSAQRLVTESRCSPSEFVYVRVRDGTAALVASTCG
jgi:hypothetical protein